MDNTKVCDIKGNVYVVGGACGGIGRAVAKKLHKHDAKLIIMDRSRNQLENLKKEICEVHTDNGNEPYIYEADITEEAEMEELALFVEKTYGKVHGIINCAGILRVDQMLKTVVETSLNEWEKILDVNLTGTFLFNKAFISMMVRQRYGDILNISSVSGQQGKAFDAPYCASKFGIIGLTESIAAELESYGVRVQCILPDAVDTQLWLQNGSSSIKPGAIMEAEHVADVIVYMITLPTEIYMLNPVIKPIKRRKVKIKR